MPNGTPTMIASPKPASTRRNVAAVLAMSARSLNNVGMLRNTSPGLGSTTGDTIRVSGVAPYVITNHTSTATPTPTAPSSRFTSGRCSARSVKNRLGWGWGWGATATAGSVIDYFASSGYTLISTRRFFALLFGSAGSAGTSHPLPTVVN